MAEIQATTHDSDPNEEVTSPPLMPGEEIQPELDSAVAQTTENMPQTAGDDERWDHDKAETLATALKETGLLDNELEARQKRIDNRNSDKLLEQLTSEERARLEESEEWLRRESDRTNHTGPSLIQNYTEGRDAAQAALDEKVEQLRKSNEQFVGESLKEVNKEVDAELSPYEELYDVNPEHFANMPTSEFMKLAEDYRNIGDKLDSILHDRQYVADNHLEFKAMYDRKAAANWDTINEMANEVISAIRANLELENQIKARYEAITEDWFDKTPRQRMDTLLSLDEEYLAQIDAEIAALRTEKDNFLNQFRPQTPHEAQT